MSTQPLPPPQDQLGVLSYRVESLERNLSTFNQLLNTYVRESENDLKLKILQDLSTSIVSDVKDLKVDLHSLKESLALLKDDLLKRDTDQRESQAQLQIRVLVGIMSAIVVVITGTLIGYITHFFH